METDPMQRPPTSPKPTVAIIGARGIGRFHANWWNMEGVEVGSIVGTNAQSVETTRTMLADMFGFSGRGYVSIERMLQEETPDFVDVCSPPDVHISHARKALEAGSDVLCEKPFVFNPKLDHQVMLAQTQELVALAQRTGRTLALSSQYSVAAPLCALLAAPDAAISSIEATLASPAKPHPESALDVWIDLGPHLLAAIQALLPGSQPDWATLKCKTDVAECCCTVEMFSGRQRVPCILHVHRSQGKPAHIRRVAINGITVDVEDYHTDAGIFAAHLVSQTGQTADHDDALRILIRRLIAGHPSMPAAVAIDNQRLLLRIARELC